MAQSEAMDVAVDARPLPPAQLKMPRLPTDALVRVIIGVCTSPPPALR